MKTPPIRTVLVDDQRLVVELLAARLHADPEIDVVGTAGDAETAVTLALAARPQVLVIDVELPGRGAFDLCAELRRDHPEIRILFLTGYLSDVLIEQALRIGAGGYLLKEEPFDQVVAAIKRVAAGGAAFSKEVEARLDLDRVSGRYVSKAESALGRLTVRQLEVMRHLAHGESVKDVAQMMELSEKSVDSHKYRIMHKLGIHDRVQLARYAIREGLTLP
ncbi:MAG: response regulator transcription factor [Planctomycetes bacterium]|nr:response regulator transcription factor [Planctomycetota bacterium]